MTTNIVGWPVNEVCCTSCPFRERDDGRQQNPELASTVIGRIGLSSSQICHHPDLAGKESDSLCRGARDWQLTMLHRIGLISEVSDEAFDRASKTERADS